MSAQHPVSGDGGNDESNDVPRQKTWDKNPWFPWMWLCNWRRFVREHCDHWALRLTIHLLCLVCVLGFPAVIWAGIVNVEDAQPESAKKGLLFVLFKGTTAIDVFLALCGILVGVVVTVVVERRNQKTSLELTSTTNIIASRVENIIKFAVISEYRQVLERIESIISHAEQTGNDLIIMNPTASFGFLMTFDADVVAEPPSLANKAARAAVRASIFDRISKHDYFIMWERLWKKKEKNSGIMKELAKTGSSHRRAKVYYATLSADKVNERDSEGGKEKVSPYRQDFAEPGTEGGDVNVVFYDHEAGTGEGFKKDQLKGKKLFLISKSIPNNRRFQNSQKFDVDKCATLKDRKELFIQFLEANQQQRILDMSEKEVGVQVRQLKNVPLQLFLSYPQNNSSKDAQCMVMFSNQYTIGQVSDIAAFSTQDWNIIEVFRAMWDVVVKREGVTEIDKQPLPKS